MKKESLPSSGEPYSRGARALVAGSSGFLGGHLVEALCRRGWEVVGVSRRAAESPTSPALPGMRRISADLRDPSVTLRVIRETRPTHVLHAAGVLPGPSVDWRTLHDGNVLTTLNLLEAIRSEDLDPWILITSSSAVYGSAGGEPAVEDAPLQPISWYGVAKVAQEMFGVQAHAANGARVVLARIFNLVGPGQPASLVISDIARQVATAEAGSGSVVQVGNLQPERDYVDVRDAVTAMVLLAEAQTRSGPYNIASGTARSVRDCVEALFRLARKPLTVETVEYRQRMVDIRRQVGSSRKLQSAISWQPRISFEDSLSDVLEHWRVRLKEEAVE